MTGRLAHLATILTAALLACGPSENAHAQVYKSKNADGETVYSDRPPAEGVPAEEVKIESGPAGQAQPAPEATRDEARRYLEEGAAESKAAKAERAEAQASQKQRKESCARARANHEKLTSGPPNRRLVEDADGTARRLDAEEMAGRVANARAQMEQACGSK